MSGSGPTIVLVHGAFQDGAATWSRVRPLLEQAGRRVVVVDLPGRGGDGLDPGGITAEMHRDAVLEAIEAEPAPVVLVGHSFGGFAISNAAEAAPGRVAALVYLSAYLPRDGQSMIDLAQTDAESLLGRPGNLVLTPDGSLASILADARADVFANDATGADREAIVAALIPEPAAPQVTPARLTDENWGRVPKAYIRTTLDRCVGPALQGRMIAAAGVGRVTRIEAGHASYVTKPAAVAAAIDASAAV